MSLTSHTTSFLHIFPFSQHPIFTKHFTYSNSNFSQSLPPLTTLLTFHNTCYSPHRLPLLRIPLTSQNILLVITPLTFHNISCFPQHIFLTFHSVASFFKNLSLLITPHASHSTPYISKQLPLHSIPSRISNHFHFSLGLPPLPNSTLPLRLSFFLLFCCASDSSFQPVTFRSYTSSASSSGANFILFFPDSIFTVYRLISFVLLLMGFSYTFPYYLTEVYLFFLILPKILNIFSTFLLPVSF